MSALVVASFNVHAGVDGWGRPYDVVGACRSLDADVLVLQETWTPLGAPGTVDAVAALGYEAHRMVMGRGHLLPPRADATDRWGPPPRPGRRRAVRLMRAGGGRVPDTSPAAPRRPTRGVPGTTGLAVLSRLEVKGVRRVDLGQLTRDRSRRGALAVTVEVGGVPVEVVGTHMSHLSQGSPLQFVRLRRALRGQGPAVLAGDMNLFAPAVGLVLPGWRAAVRGRTWPAWQPVAQPDNILVRGPLRVVEGIVGNPAGSDHRPVIVRVEPV